MDFAEILYDCLERIGAGNEAELEALCTKHPEHAERLRREVTRLRRLGLVTAATTEVRARVPERLGGFRLLEVLGEGGMGLVYAAEEEALGRRVALKMVRPEQLHFPGARQRFQREVEAVARLQHPGIVPVYTVGEDGGVPFFTMEPIDGCTLADVLAYLRGAEPAHLTGRDLARAIDGCARSSDGRARSGEASARGGDSSATARGALFEGRWVEACVQIAREVAEALDYAHGRGLVHRDVKPSNIAITRSGRAMLLDFGLTQSAAADRVTRTGSHPGSIPYMSPEQLAGAADLDGRTDVYSLGITLYELVSLSPAFRGTPAEVLVSIQHGDLPRLREKNRAASRDLETVFSIAAAQDRRRRYGSAGDLARDLGHLLAHRPIEARRASPALRTLRWAERHPAWAVGTTLGCLLLFGVPSALLIQQSRANRAMSDKNIELKGALSRAQSESERAEANLGSALDSVDRLLARVAEDRLENIPGMDIVRQELLEDALAFYATLDHQRAGAARPSADAVRVRLALSRLLDMLGHSEQADSLEREQIHFLRAAHLASPGEELPARQLASSLQSLALRLIRAAREEESTALLEEAAALLEEVDCATGGDPALDTEWWKVRLTQAELAFTRGDLEAARDEYAALDEEGSALLARGQLPSELWPQFATALANRSYLLNHLADPAGAIDVGQRAVAIGERAAGGGWVRSREYVMHNAAAQIALGCERLGRLEEQETWLRRAFDTATQLAERHPDVIEYRELLASDELNLGRKLALADREDEALPFFEASVRSFEALAAAQPGSARIGYGAATALMNLALFHHNHDQGDAAVAHAERALAHALKAWESVPKNPDLALLVGLCSRDLAGWLTVRGDHRRAAEILSDEPERMLERGVPYSGAIYRKLAGILAASARLAQADTDSSSAERAEAVEQCTQRALRCLASAVELGWKDRNDIQASEDLEPVRAQPGFQAVLEKLP